MPAAPLLCVTSTIPALFIAKFYINLCGLENCSEKFKSNANVSTRLQTYEHKCKKTIKIHFSATLKIFSQSTHNVEDVLWLKMWPHKIYVSLIHGIIQINLIKLPWGTQDFPQTDITLKAQYTRGAPTVVLCCRVCGRARWTAAATTPLASTRAAVSQQIRWVTS